jgi:hypothetical protein
VYAGGVAQGVECLPIKCTALNSNHQKEKEKHVKKQRVQCVRTQFGEGGVVNLREIQSVGGLVWLENCVTFW